MVAEGLWGESRGQRERHDQSRPGETPLDRASLAWTWQRLLAGREEPLEAHHNARTDAFACAVILCRLLGCGDRDVTKPAELEGAKRECARGPEHQLRRIGERDQLRFDRVKAADLAVLHVVENEARGLGEINVRSAFRTKFGGDAPK